MLKPKSRAMLYKALALRGKVCAEIGVCHGENAEEILRNDPSKLFLFDPWYAAQPQGLSDLEWGHYQAAYGGPAAQFEYVRGRFSAHSAVEIVRAESLDAATQFPDSYFDFVYIDGNHSEAAVAADLRAWWPLVKQGGWLCGHDFSAHTWPGVVNAVVDFQPVAGLVDAMTRWCEQDGHPSWGFQK